MAEDRLSMLRKYRESKKLRRIWKRFAAILGCIVVFCTVYALILPAVALDRSCGMEEHTHTQACYRQVDSGENRRLVCSPHIHSHTSSCYDEGGNLVCGYADYLIHVHDESCYDAQGNLVCPLPEIPEDWDPETGEGRHTHIHTSDCYDENGQLVCGQLETYAHTHSANCFVQVQPPLTCTIPEGEEHTHTALCYGHWELICGLPEHTHTADCCKSREPTGEPTETAAAPSATEDASAPTEDTTSSATEDASAPTEDTTSSATEDASAPTEVTTPSPTEDTAAPTDTTEPSGNEEAAQPTAPADPTAPPDGTDREDPAALPDGPIPVDPYIEEVILKYKTPQNDQWQDIAGATIPGDASLGLKVQYKDVPISLLHEHGGQLTYTLPELLQSPVAEGIIKADEDGRKIGTVELNGHKLLMTFDADWLEGQIASASQTVWGSFRVESGINIALIPDGGRHDMVIGEIHLNPDFESNLLAKYGNVSVTKTCAPTVSQEGNGDYLEYTLTLEAGPNGCLDVKVEDRFTANGSFTAYDGAADVPLTDTGWPRETIQPGRIHGSISHKAQSPAAPLGGMVWAVGDMAPNEVRTLTYRVRLLDGYTKLQNGNHKAICNEAAAYSGSDFRSQDVVNFEPKAGLNMNKSHGDAERNPDDGSYLLTYKVWVEAYNDNNFRLKNVRIVDSLHHEMNPTAAEVLPYISYVKDSFRLYRTKDLTGEQLPINGPEAEFTLEYAGDEKSFTLHVGDMNAKDVYCLQYQIRVGAEAFGAISGESLAVCNRALAYSDNAEKCGMRHALEAYNTKAQLTYQHWVQKTVGNCIEQKTEVPMSGIRYDIAAGQPVVETAAPDCFAVPAGSYRYTVSVNDLGDWDVREAVIADRLENEHMKYVGYVRVDAYTPKGAGNTVPTDPAQTRWIKVDGMSQFRFTMAQIALDDPGYAYQLTYYAAPANMDTVSHVSVVNSFTLSGKVGLGAYTTDLAGIRTEVTVVIQGGHSFEAKKHPWYYEGAKDSAGQWAKGALYWVIQVNGTEVHSDIRLQDRLQPDSNMVFYENSLVGIYTGAFPAGESITAYKDMEALLASNRLTELPSSEYQVSFGNSRNFPGADVRSEITIQLNRTVQLAEGHAIYLIVKASPTVLPVGNRDIKTYTNNLRSSDDGNNWVERDTASKTLYGGENILKELGKIFTYDGTTVNVLYVDRGGWVPRKDLPGPGTYVSWAVKVNYAGKLSGRYRVVDTIPDGMELAFVRLKWLGDKADPGTGMCQIPNLDAGWKEHTITAEMDNFGKAATSCYYTSGNQVLWEVEPLIAGGEGDVFSADFQVVCRVTDPEVLLGGQKKTFHNQVVLQTADGAKLDFDSNSVALETSSMNKTAVPGGGTIPFAVTVNPLGEDLVQGAETITFVDEMSDTLRLNTDSIRVTDQNGKPVAYTASLKGHVLKIVIPDGKKLTVHYTAHVAAAPGQTVAISNHAYWEGYGNKNGGSCVEFPEYTYRVDATAGGSTSPTITVRKIDENNLTHCLEGAAFRLEKGTMDRNGSFTPDPMESPQEQVTDRNGLVVFGGKLSLLEYNTVYRIMEIEAPAGYVLDETPYYVVVAKEEEGGYPSYPEGVTVYYESPNFTMSVENHKGEAYVEKKFQNIEGTPIERINGTYRFGLYGNPQAAGKPLQTVEFTVSDTAKAPRGTFINLEQNRKYYIYELDDDGNPITGPEASIVDSRPFAVTYRSGAAEGSCMVQAGGTVTVTNRLLTEALPKTGGPGIFLYTATGLMLLCGGGWVWYRKIRSGREMR